MQASLELVEPRTRAGEIGALSEAMSETGLREGTIVTLSGREDVDAESGVIRVRPAWEWVLGPGSVLGSDGAAPGLGRAGPAVAHPGIRRA